MGLITYGNRRLRACPSRRHLGIGKSGAVTLGANPMAALASHLPASIRRKTPSTKREESITMRKKTVNLTAVIYPDTDSDWLVAHNPETGTTTQGETFEEALANLKEATELYLSEFPQATKGRAILTTFVMFFHTHFSAGGSRNRA